MSFTPVNPGSNTAGTITPGFRPVTIGGISVEPKQKNPFLEANKGMLKGILSTFEKAGAQNAGPVGAAMLKNAPAFAENIKAAQEALKPKNTEQQFGFTTERAAEFLIPAAQAAKTEQSINLLTSGLGKLTGAVSRIGLKTALQAGIAGVQTFAQTGNIKQAVQTAEFAGGLRGGMAIIGEGANALHLPERLYSTIFKNSAKDMITELKTNGIAALKQSDPAKFQDFVNKGIIKVAEDGTPILNDTLAEQALDKGLRGSIRGMANEVITKTFDSEDEVQKLVSQSNTTIKVPNYQRLASVLDDVAQRYENVGDGSIASEADRLSGALKTGVQVAQTNPALLLGPGKSALTPNTINLPSGTSNAVDYVGKNLLPEVASSQGTASTQSLTAGTLNAEDTLSLRRFLDKLRIASSYDTQAPLSQTQGNFKYWSDTFRGLLTKNIPGIEDTMKNYSFYIDALESLAKEASRRGNNQVLSLIDSLFLSGAYAGNNPVPGVTMGILRKLIMSAPGTTYLGQALKNSTISPLGSAAVSAGSSALMSPPSDQLPPEQSSPEQQVKPVSSDNPSIFDKIGNAIIPKAGAMTLDYNRTDQQMKEISPIIPKEYQKAVVSGAERAGIDPKDFAALLKHENGGNWKATLHGTANPRDVGVAQMNTAGKNSTLAQAIKLYEEEYGRSFNRLDIQDQILAAALWIRNIKQEFPNADFNEIATRYHFGLNTKSGSKNVYTKAVQAVREKL